MRFRSRRIGRLFLGTVITIFTVRSAEAADRCDAFPELLHKVSQARGLEPLTPIGCRVVPESDLRRNPYVVRGFAAVQRTLDFDEQIYKMIGFLPDRYRYRECLTTFGPEVPEVLYDAESSSVLVRAGSTEGEDAIAEEIVRALLDQHFNTRSLISQAIKSTDRMLSILAAVNGDALNSVGSIQGLSTNDSDSDPMSHLSVKPECQVPETLLYLGEFAQRFGVLYTNHFRTKGGNAQVDEVFKNPPKSTSDILYKLNPVREAPPPVPEIQVAPPPATLRHQGFLLKHHDTLGEYVIRTLLRNYMGSAAALNAARGWNGDSLGLYRNAKDDALIVWDTRWTNEEEAREFYQAFRVLLFLRFRVDPNRTLDRFIFQSSSGDRFEAERKKTQVMISVLRPGPGGSTE